MPTFATPRVAFDFVVQNSESMVISPDSNAIELSGISNPAHNLNALSIPLILIRDEGYEYGWTRREGDHLFQLSSFEEDEPGSSTSGNRYWVLFKHHPSTGVVRLATGPSAGTYNENPNMAASIPRTGWTLLNGTNGALRIRQKNLYLSPPPTPTTGGVLPSSISGLKIWLKADAGLTTFTQGANTYLTSWADQSGSGQSMVRYTGYQGDGNILVYPNRVNGKPSIAVNGYRTHLILEPITNLVLGPDTTTLCVHNDIQNQAAIYSMGHRQVLTSYPYLYRYHKIGLRRSFHDHPSSFVVGDRYTGDIISNGYFSSQAFTANLRKFKLFSRITQMSPLNIHQFRVDGGNNFIRPSTGTVPDASAYLSFGDIPFYSEWGDFGARSSGVLAEIAEFIHFNRALTDQELANVTEGLRIKYALY